MYITGDEKNLGTKEFDVEVYAIKGEYFLCSCEMILPTKIYGKYDVKYCPNCGIKLNHIKEEFRSMKENESYLKK